MVVPGSSALTNGEDSKDRARITSSARPISRGRSIDPLVDGGGLARSQLIEQARSALARGEAETALAPLLEHRQAFPEGRLTEERDALEIQALVALGRVDEATSRAAAFRENHPTSLLRPAIDALVR